VTAFESQNVGLSAELALSALRRRDAYRLSELARDVYAVDFDNPKQVAAFREIIDLLVERGDARVELDLFFGIVARAV
jgi:hypothetical protein